MRDVMNAIIGYNDEKTDEVKLAYAAQRYGQIINANTRGNLKKSIGIRDLAFEWEKFEHQTKWSEDEWQEISEEVDRLFEMGHKKTSWEKRGKKQFKGGKWLEQ